MKQKIEIEVDVPDGWEATGEYRHLNEGDFYMPESGSCARWLLHDRSDDAYLILRRVEPVKESRWVNLYVNSIGGPCRSRQECNEVGVSGRIAAIRIDYENGKPVNVALESVEGEG